MISILLNYIVIWREKLQLSAVVWFRKSYADFTLYPFCFSPFTPILLIFKIKYLKGKYFQKR